MNLNKYTKQQLYQIIKMILKDYSQNAGEDFKKYVKELDENTYIDKYNNVCCKMCCGPIKNERCSCYE